MGGNISRDPPSNSKRMRSGFRNNSTAATIRTEEEKPSIIQQKPSKRVIYGRSYHANPDSTYMLPRDDKEIDRLHEEHFVTKELLGL